MRRIYRNVHIALITALLLVAVAFEAGAGDLIADRLVGVDSSDSL